MKIGKLLGLMLPLVLLMVLAVACGDDEPAAPAGLTAADLQAAVAGIQQPAGLSAADVSKVVSDAIAAQPGISAADLQAAVDAAVTASAGISNEDLQAAIAGIQLPAGLTRADVSKIVADAIAAQPGISATDLQNAVDTAVDSAVAAVMATPQVITKVEVVEVQGKRGGILVDARTTDAPDLNIWFRGLTAQARILGLVYSPMVTVDPALNLTPALAESWEIKDGTNWVFYLRDGVKFHDGQPFSGEDVKYTYDAYMDEERGSTVGDFLTNVEAVNLLDPMTIEFRLEAPYGNFLLGQWMNGIASKAYADEDTFYYDDKANGTGPWILTEWKPDVEHTLRANPDYYIPGIPLMDGIRVQTIPEESTIIAGLRTGIIDHAFLEDNQNFSLVQKSPDLVIHQHAGLGSCYAMVNPNGTGADGPLTDKRVRQAMSLGMDREAILNLVGGGLGSVSGWFPASQPAYYTPVSELPLYVRDIDRAKQLLTDAGYPDGFKMDIITISTFPVMKLTGDLLVEQWKEIGIDATARHQEVGLWVDDLIAGNYGVSTNLCGGELDPDGHPRNFLHSEGTVAQWIGLVDPEISAHIDAARGEADRAEQNRLYKELQLEIIDKGYIYYTYSPAEIDVVQRWVKNYSPNPLEAIQIFFAQTWLDR